MERTCFSAFISELKNQVKYIIKVIKYFDNHYKKF